MRLTVLFCRRLVTKKRAAMALHVITIIGRLKSTIQLAHFLFQVIEAVSFSKSLHRSV